MKSPLAVDKETVEKYGITPELEIPALNKLSYLQAQLQEIQMMQWRARVDIIHAKRLQEEENEVLKAKGNNNYAQHLNEVQQATGAIKMLRVMIDELRKEYPELKVEEE